VSGTVASTDEVRQEFANRQEVNKQRAREEEERKNAQRNQVNNMPRRDLKLGNKIYLCHGEQMVDGAATANLEVVNLRLKEFTTSSSHTHAFFSTFSPDVLLEQLTQKMTEQGQAFEISNTTWKVGFNLTKPLTEAEEDDASPRFAEHAKAQVEILKVQG